MKNNNWVVKFPNGGKPFWLAPWDGDPGRTLVESNAEDFGSIKLANMAIEEAKKSHPTRNLDNYLIYQRQY